MKEKERISILRLIPLVVIAGMTAVTSCVFCYMNQFYLDEWLCVFVLDAVFFLILVFELEYERKRRMIANNAATTFSGIAGGYTVCCILMMAFAFMPEFFRPVIIIPIIMCAIGNEVIGIVTGLYLVLLFGLTCGGNYYELLCGCLLILLGGTLAKALDEPKFRIYISILLLCISIVIPGIFYYWSYTEMKIHVYVYGILCGLATFLVALQGYKRLKKNADEELDNRFWDILSEDYPQVREVRTFFPAEYAHAQRVSDIAVSCAKELGYRVNLCAAAGFYYRLGRWLGEPYISKGVAKARELCFPVELIQILSEYYGEEALPQTPESALVQMIDAVTKKMDAMNQNVGQSQWNREMIIYQTLNEYSSMGLYDECGMSMNQFLKVREFLVKEKHLQ